MPHPLYAHTLPDRPQEDWEPLFTEIGDSNITCQGRGCEKCQRLEADHGHLNKVAFWAAKFASEMFRTSSIDATSASDWGYLAGLWHDLGKFAPVWQTYLKSKSDIHSDEVVAKVDHSTAGAQHATKAHSVLGHLLGYPIAGHHSGLLDGLSNNSCQAKRLQKADLPDWQNAPLEVRSQAIPPPPGFLPQEPFSLSFFTRMIFSSLVDADFLATEAFMNPSQGRVRSLTPENSLESIAGLIDARIDGFGTPSPEDEVNIQRRNVVDDCRAAASSPPGIFSLTVPTGGGKTLSSLSFALRHAIAHGQQRVIYVVPFTSIIEQNAEVIREILAPLESSTFTPLIEHHSSLSPDKESAQARLASENWDAPIIITTAVQFYESLFAAKTSRCRKLHNIANSVVILDEAQSLPVDFLSPCLRVLQELTEHYHTTAVLCTATQPAVNHDAAEFPIGLKNCREIIANTSALFAALERVKVEALGDVTDSTLAQRLADHQQVLCIVNRRKHAQQIFQQLGEEAGNYHLSALMCPEHRSRILTEVRTRLRDGLPVRVISTQLIEAGVDVDFPVVYRALAGLDSIAQAAGRCNRNGKLSTPGQTYVFRPEDQRAETYFRETAQVAHQLIDLHPDLLGREAIRHYFDLYYYQQKSRWDSKDILGHFRIDGRNQAFPFDFSYSSVAEKFRLIDDWQVSVIIPYDDRSRSLIADLRSSSIPLHRKLLRALQRYTVQIPPRLRDDNIRSFEALRDGQFYALVSTDLNYSEHFGLTFDEGHCNSQKLIC
jgi:CRISPR-associated endonuclease/helicase Cas3